MEENKVRHCCNTCKNGFLSQCKILKSQPEYEKYESNGEIEWFRFKENFICPEYSSRYIQYPIQVTRINYDERMNLNEPDIGRFVRIKPCGEEYEDKTYLGLFLGDLPIDIRVRHNSSSGELSVGFRENPAIFVFALNKIIYGMESWWGIIESEDDLKEITQDVIEGQWYVKALKKTLGNSQKEVPHDKM